MPSTTLLRQRLLTIFLAAMLLLFSPLALQFAALGGWRGIPALLIYLYGLWAVIIALAAWAAIRCRE